MAALLLGGSLAACGFRLTGAGTLPPAMAKTYVESSRPNSEFFGSLRSALRLRGLEVVETPDEAGAQLIITEDNSGQRVLSVSARNIPREYEVFYSVTFTLAAGDQNLVEAQSLIARRSYTYDETEVLAKAREERILEQTLADDLARQVMRRIEAAGSGGPVPIT